MQNRQAMIVALVMVVIGCLLVFIAKASAQAPIAVTMYRALCYEPGHVRDMLKFQSMERIRGAGIGIGGDTMVELWVSKDGTFTLLSIHKARACIALAGDNWNVIDEPTLPL